MTQQKLTRQGGLNRAVLERTIVDRKSDPGPSNQEQLSLRKAIKNHLKITMQRQCNDQNTVVSLRLCILNPSNVYNPAVFLEKPDLRLSFHRVFCVLIFALYMTLYNDYAH